MCYTKLKAHLMFYLPNPGLCLTPSKFRFILTPQIIEIPIFIKERIEKYSIGNKILLTKPAK